MSDFKWTSNGGTLLDGSGDISMATPRESLIDMTRTRVKAALDGWKLYRIGADLESFTGKAIEAEMEISIKRQIQTALQNQFLASGSYSIKTVVIGTQIDVYIYVSDELIAKATINQQTGILRVN